MSEPTTPPPGQISPDGQQLWNGTAWIPNPNLPKPKKKHTVRNIILIVLVLFFGGIASCLALIGGTANEIDKSIKKDDANAAKDVTLGACPVPPKDEFSPFTGKITIKNSSKKTQTFLGTIYLTKGDKQVGTGDILEDVNGSATSKIEVNLYGPNISDLKASDVEGTTCTLKKVSAFETE